MSIAWARSSCFKEKFSRCSVKSRQRNKWLFVRVFKELLEPISKIPCHSEERSSATEESRNSAIETLR
jgi:hypothetical protein